MLGLQLLWTVRLTYNTHRRGFLTNLHEEDYRYAVVRTCEMDPPTQKVLNWLHRVLQAVRSRIRPA